MRYRQNLQVCWVVTVSRCFTVNAFHRFTNDFRLHFVCVVLCTACIWHTHAKQLKQWCSLSSANVFNLEMKPISCVFQPNTAVANIIRVLQRRTVSYRFAVEGFCFMVLRLKTHCALLWFIHDGSFVMGNYAKTLYAVDFFSWTTLMEHSWRFWREEKHPCALFEVVFVWSLLFIFCICAVCDLHWMY